MAYYVVKFRLSNDVAAVPSNWLSADNTSCYWPPSSMRNIRSLVERRVAPSNEWDLYMIQILGVFNTYGEARKKLRVAEEQSDLNSTDQENCGRGKRQKKIRRLSSSSTQSEEIKLPEPPQLSLDPKMNAVCHLLAKAQGKTDTQDSSLTFSTDYNVENIQSGGVLLPRSPSLLDGFGDAAVGSSKNKGSTSANCAKESSRERDVCNKCAHTIEEYLKVIMKDVKVIKVKQKIHEEYLDSLLRKTDNLGKPQFEESNEEIKDILRMLPLKTEEHLALMEKELLKTEVMNSMISHLRKVGGNTYQQNVKFLLSTILSNKFAREFSFLGARGKKPFKTLLVFKLISNVIAANDNWKNVTNNDINQVTSSWLRQAKGRKLE